VTRVGITDYWQRSFVSEDGGLRYRFPGPFDGYGVTIKVGLAQSVEVIRQELASPGIPIVRTVKRAGELEIEEEALAAWPFETGEAAPAARPAIERLDAKRVHAGWAAPPQGIDPAFRNIAVGYGEPVRYRFLAAKATPYTVIFGLCEGWHARADQRIQDLRIEGMTRKTVDMVAEEGKNVPALYAFEARDGDGDGWIDIAVATTAGSPDGNAFLNVLWIFPGREPPPLAELFAGRASKPPLVHLDCGGGPMGDNGHPRHDLLFVSIHNAGSSEARVKPVLTIRTEERTTLDPGRMHVELGSGIRIDCAMKYEVADSRGNETVLRFSEVGIPAGSRHNLAFSVARGDGATVLFKSIAGAEGVLERAQRYWTSVAVRANSECYSRVCEPPVPHALIPLPPGAVEPAGWLRDWAVSAREGITGHLDEDHPTFGEAWKGKRINAPNAAADGTGWPLEQCAYWLDGALRLGLVLDDKALIKKIRARLDPVVDGVLRADFGTSFIYWKKGDKPEGFNSWAHSQLGRALVALYHGTDDRRVLDALVKVYVDYPANMGPIHFFGVSGLCNLDAMLETYSFSGDRRILDRALQAIAQPGVEKEIQAWQQGRLSPGHMVILYENIRLPAIVYSWSGEPSLLQATRAAFKWLDDHHMLPYGVTCGEEWGSGIGAFRKTETCDVTAMLLSTSWMYRIEGDSDWGDRMERAFFNAGAAPVARDFQTMCYYQSPNRIRSDSLPCEQPHSPGPEGVRFHRLGCASVLCCVGALNRIIPNFIIHMWMATRDNGLAATLYGPCTVSALAGARVPVKVTTTTDYPFGETIRMKVEPEASVTFPLYLRIPKWCQTARIQVNGTPVTTTPNDKGFARIARTWTKADVVELELPMEPRVVRGYETEFPSANRKYFDFEPPEVFEPRRLPYATVLCGPLLFALPIPDVDPNTPAAGAKWRYALDTDARRGDAGLAVERKAMPAHWNWPLDAPVAVKAPVQAFDWKPSDAHALPDAPVTGTASETIRLVPYGCTKFRISMFPVTYRAWTQDRP